MTSFLPNKQQMAFRKGTIKIRTQPRYELWLKTTLEIFWGKMQVNQHRYIKCSNMSLLRVRKQQEILTSITINIQMTKRKKRVPRPHPWSTYIDPSPNMLWPKYIEPKTKKPCSCCYSHSIGVKTNKPWKPHASSFLIFLGPGPVIFKTHMFLPWWPCPSTNKPTPNPFDFYDHIYIISKKSYTLAQISR